MAQTIEPRSLLQDKIKKVEINDEILFSYLQWELLMREKKSNIENIDAFFAGWVMANPVVRDQFKSCRGNISIESLIKAIKEKKENA